VDKPDASPWSAGGGTLDAARIATRDVWFAGRAAPTPVYERDRLPGLARVDGPAIVEEFGATTVVFPAWLGRLDGAGNLVLERGAGSTRSPPRSSARRSPRSCARCA